MRGRKEDMGGMTREKQGSLKKKEKRRRLYTLVYNTRDREVERREERGQEEIRQRRGEKGRGKKSGGENRERKR